MTVLRVKQWLVNLIITHLFSWKQAWHKTYSLQNGQIHNAYQYLLSGSPSVGKTARGKTHELIIQMHQEAVTWTDQLKQKLYLGGRDPHCWDLYWGPTIRDSAFQMSHCTPLWSTCSWSSWAIAADGVVAAALSFLETFSKGIRSSMTREGTGDSGLHMVWWIQDC